MSAGRQRGFTMIELMISLAISSLLVTMVLGISTRISLAYRGQQQISNVQQVLAAARAAIEADAKQAGLAIAQGFTVGATGAALHSPVAVTNSATAPDRLALFYADTTTQAAIPASAVVASTTQIEVDSSVGFSVGDLVVLSTPAVTTQNPLNPTTDANIATFTACVVKISGVTATQISFTTAAPYGSAGNAHCAAPVRSVTMVYKLIARAYRIDGTRPVDGVLQVSPSGDLDGTATDYQDLAYGFTDLQVATRFFDNDAADSPDLDTDPKREWYSGAMQQTLTATGASPFVTPIELSISLVARTDRDVDSVGTAATPTLLDPARVDNNQLGDRASVTLPSPTDPALKGNRIYRFTTFGVDLRNLGVGR